MENLEDRLRENRPKTTPLSPHDDAKIRHSLTQINPASASPAALRLASALSVMAVLLLLGAVAFAVRNRDQLATIETAATPEQALLAAQLEPTALQPTPTATMQSVDLEALRDAYTTPNATTKEEFEQVIEVREQIDAFSREILLLLLNSHNRWSTLEGTFQQSDLLSGESISQTVIVRQPDIAQLTSNGYVWDYVPSNDDTFVLSMLPATVNEVIPTKFGHPLLSIPRVGIMLFPNALGQHLGRFVLLQETQFLDRSVFVVEHYDGWSEGELEGLLWIDKATGVILRRQQVHLPLNKPPLVTVDTQFLSIAFDSAETPPTLNNGYELYSWVDDEQNWHYALLPATTIVKPAESVQSAETHTSLDTLKQSLRELPDDTTVTWHGGTHFANPNATAGWLILPDGQQLAQLLALADVQQLNLALPERPDAAYHTVQAGDTVGSISVQYDVSQYELLQLNQLENDTLLYPDQHILLSPSREPSLSIQINNYSFNELQTANQIGWLEFGGTVRGMKQHGGLYKIVTEVRDEAGEIISTPQSNGEAGGISPIIWSGSSSLAEIRLSEFPQSDETFQIFAQLLIDDVVVATAQQRFTLDDLVNRDEQGMWMTDVSFVSVEMARTQDLANAERAEPPQFTLLPNSILVGFETLTDKKYDAIRLDSTVTTAKGKNVNDSDTIFIIDDFDFYDPLKRGGGSVNIALADLDLTPTDWRGNVSITTALIGISADGSETILATQTINNLTDDHNP